MSGNSFGKLFTLTTAGESHGDALVGIVDGCPPGMKLKEEDLQGDLDLRKPGSSRHTTQRRESDTIKIVSGTFEGVTTGTPIALLIENTDQRPRDYTKIAIKFAMIMDLFLIGSASKYRSVKAESLAKTMVSKVDSKPGVNYFYFDDFFK